jgi:hypothetical protein
VANHDKSKISDAFYSRLLMPNLIEILSVVPEVKRMAGEPDINSVPFVSFAQRMYNSS